MIADNGRPFHTQQATCRLCQCQQPFGQAHGPPRKLTEMLGPTRFEYGELEPEDQVGAATGLVVTAAGLYKAATRCCASIDFRPLFPSREEWGAMAR